MTSGMILASGEGFREGVSSKWNRETNHRRKAASSVGFGAEIP